MGSTPISATIISETRPDLSQRACTSSSASKRKRRIEMRTRCKFRVVGIENVEHAIFKKVYKSDVSAEEYEAITSQ